MSATGFRQELVGLFGRPVAENPAQPMIEAAFRAHGLPWRYLTIEVAPEDLGDAVRGARAMGFRGFHCTIPHKVSVIDHLDELGRSAGLIGAVNCVVASGARLVGENTDGQGFLDSLRTVLDPHGAGAVVLGAGGAARAIAVELALAGVARLTIVNRGEARGRELCSLLEGEVGARVGHRIRADFKRWTGRYAADGGTDLLVNATPIGLPPDTAAEVPVDLDAMRGGSVVADVIPARDTPLLRRARASGLQALDGLGMLVAQGSLAVERWAGVSPDRAGMKAALVAAMGAEATMA
jgi:shikimate dehydrogenase